ncbi:MAG: hypothetical protein V2A76_01280 [Planctomycetota bacterium]
MILAGIDEAGYGPVLGPLVVGLASFRTSPEEGNDLWQRLAGAVESRIAASGPEAGGLPVLDSKQLYKSGQDLAPLETVALSFSCFASGGLPRTAGDFLGLHCDREGLQLERYPWYAESLPSLPLPLRAGTDAILRAAERLRLRADSAGVEPVLLRLRPLLTGEFNRLTRRAGSKAKVLFDQNASLIEDLVRRHRPVRILCDRHGGRRRYGALIEAAFPMARVKILSEERERASYQVGEPDGGFKLTFQVKGEQHGLEVALASILAKYTRELFMAAFNHHFAGIAPGIRRTAGYYTDGHRFLTDLEQSGAFPSDHRELLVRCK